MHTFAQDARVLDLNVDKHQRRAVIVDRSRGRSKPVVVFTADSTCLEVKNGNQPDPRFTKMGDVNGINDAAQKYGFVAVHLLPLRRLGGLVSGWNTQGGLLAYHPEYDDVNYAKEVIDRIWDDYHDSLKVFVGFSAGAQFGHILLGKASLNSIFSGIVPVSGTLIGTEGLTPIGVSFIGFHGADDDKLPYKGGLPTSTVARLVARFLLVNGAAKSNPALQELQYSWVNGYGTFPVKETQTPVGVRKQYHGDGHSVKVVAYRAVAPWGGHTYHGRGNVESLLSPGNGRPAPASLYSINDLWAQELGLEPL